jgi:hypothetical protein
MDFFRTDNDISSPDGSGNPFCESEKIATYSGKKLQKILQNFLKIN